MPPLRCLQMFTAAAALFAVLGACGLAPARSAPRPIVRPHPPGADATIRSLTGTWDAVVQGVDGPETLSLTLLQYGDAISGTLTIDGVAYRSDAAVPSHLDARGQFTLGFWQSQERVWLHGRPDVSGDRIAGWMTGARRASAMASFVRR